MSGSSSASLGQRRDSSPLSGFVTMGDDSVKGFRTKIVNAKKILQVNVGGDFAPVRLSTDIPIIRQWLSDGIAPHLLTSFYSQVEQLWNAFVDHDVKLRGHRDCFNQLIEKMNLNSGTALPEDRPTIPAKDFGVLYYNSKEDLLVRGTIDENRRTGKGPSATPVHLSPKKDHILLQQNTLYVIAGNDVEVDKPNDAGRAGEEGEEICTFWCSCGGLRFICGPNGKKRTCQERYLEEREILGKLGMPFQHCVRLPTDEKLALYGYKRKGVLGRHVLMGYDVRICCVTTDDGRKYNGLTYAAFRECPEDFFGNSVVLAEKNPSSYCDFDGCSHEDFLMPMDLLRVIPETVECFACPPKRSRDLFMPPQRPRVEKYLARRRFKFDNVAKIAEFFSMWDETVIDILTSTQGIRAFFRKENTEFMSGTPETKGQVLLKKAPARDKLLRGIYCLPEDSQLYREADDTPVHAVVCGEGWRFCDGAGELPEIPPFQALGVAAKAVLLQRSQKTDSQWSCTAEQGGNGETSIPEIDSVMALDSQIATTAQER